MTSLRRMYLVLLVLTLFARGGWADSPPPALASLAELKTSPLGSIQLQAALGAWPEGQAARLLVTQSAETAKDFETTFTGDRKTQKRLPQEVRIQGGKLRPRSNVVVRWVLPAAVVLGITPPLVMAQFLYDSESESHDYFTEIPSSFNSATHELKATVDPKYFTDERGEAGQFEAILVVVTGSKK